ncbi:hypothetical protein GCM10008910_45490 [Faecalicatena orotica]|uniref:Uncharacterized protein n=1 Tax=Faecalicatena orotica TaxID=1544 RepID=A0A2Y9BDF1_9FIRM|nr:hypothetical protein [Faecalicatena orotica]PWJ29507.1 hypothetical protein A8806_106246 [Faecalicatena orotica]SSA55962.1 hypothetical protein SAMN05216536_106246 [Faecalicatena orotica]
MKELFTINNDKYSLQYNMNIVSRIEQTLNCSIPYLISKGVYNSRQLQTMLAFGLVDSEGKHISIKTAMTIAGKLIAENKESIKRMVVGTIVTDIPFTVKGGGD